VSAEQESIYRCAECRSGKRLSAWAAVCVHGPLSLNGKMDSYDYDDETLLYEDSIRCADHPWNNIEKLVDGRWCRWWVCPTCRGERQTRWGICREPGLPPEPRTYGERHEGWRPVEEFAEAAS